MPYRIQASSKGKKGSPLFVPKKKDATKLIGKITAHNEKAHKSAVKQWGKKEADKIPKIRIGLRRVDTVPKNTKWHKKVGKYIDYENGGWKKGKATAGRKAVKKNNFDKVFPF